MPLLSVIVPVLDSPEMLALCLASVRNSAFDDYELLVADDGSRDAEAVRQTAERFRARVTRAEKTRGPASARNAAASMATGEVLVFLDADCTVHPDTLQRFADAFTQDPSLDALMGSYDAKPPVRGLVAAFRNLLHAHVHHRSSREAATFWTGCGAMRRISFERMGGFDENWGQLEDVELGLRLHKAGGRLALDPQIQASHHKEWSLLSMLRTDIFDRAIPWTELIFRHGMARGLNFRWQDLAAAAVALMLPALSFLAVRYGHVWIGAVIGALLALGVLQWPLWRALARWRSVPFGAASVPLYIAHQLAAAAGLAIGICRWELMQDRWLPWAGGILAVLVFGVVQLGAGAYLGEFDGHPDEAAHFMTGLMIRDYLVSWPGQPQPWAEQYYLHYPKVAFGHWPPLFHLLEAAWWLFLPPARWSVMLLIGAVGLTAALLFYRVARQVVHPIAAALLACVMAVTPVFQQSLAQTMAETTSLLFGVLFLDALWRMAVTGPSRGRAAELSLWLILCLMVKGTAAALLPAPLLMLAITGHASLLKKRAVWLTSLCLLAGSVVLFAIQLGSLGEVVLWSGLRLDTPWRIESLPSLAGWGALALAAGGLATLRWVSSPPTAAAGAMLVSVVASSFLLRAMAEPRHWILALPPILLLGASFVQRLASVGSAWMGRTAAALAIAAGLAAFPWSHYGQEPRVHEPILDRLRLPVRALVSSTPDWHEGGWIAMASLREDRPASVIARASKVLSSSRWSGTRYRMLVDTPDAVEEMLDRFGFEAVILDDRPSSADPPGHHQLLKQTLAASSAWRECAVLESVSCWCRATPPRTVRQPLRIRPGGRLGDIVER